MDEHRARTIAFVAARDQTVDAARQGGFATTASSGYQQQLATLQFERDVLDGYIRAAMVAESEIFDNKRIIFAQYLSFTSTVSPNDQP
jgi:hypothetical protein